MKSETMHIGVDVSKEKLDIYNPKTNAVTTEPNTIEGFRVLRSMARKANAIVCCEPTGGFELEMILFLQKFNIPVAYCDGYRVRHYALSTGQFSKNDKVDARMIARYADSAEIRVLDTKDNDQLELRKRLSLYHAFIDMHVLLVQKASSERDISIKAMLQTESKRLKSKATKMQSKCLEIIARNERMHNLYVRFLSIDGIGQATAITVIAEIPEIGNISDAAIAKLSGVAPMDHQSGKTDHTKHVYGGRKKVRNALYMAAVAAVKFNHILSEYYQSLKLRMPGPKASKWALLPVMRKIAILMNRIARNPDFIPEAKPRIKAA